MVLAAPMERSGMVARATLSPVPTVSASGRPVSRAKPLRSRQAVQEEQNLRELFSGVGLPVGHNGTAIPITFDGSPALRRVRLDEPSSLATKKPAAGEAAGLEGWSRLWEQEHLSGCL